MKTIITIAFILCSIGVSAQSNAFPTLSNITFTNQSSSPVLTWEKGSIKDRITPIDTTYEMYGDKPLRRISYRYATKDDKPMECIEKDVYNGKDWDFNSITIQPYKNPWGAGDVVTLKNFQQYYNDNTIYLTNPVQTVRKP